ncbi:hypothetical protein PsYK624_049660 [Phanerochaete sordida]|uniref:DUF6533 domain-containing protein n=1 Tax=Phanerochaete sordida TaxID=48140 RepID=A0A9P3G7J2_9APHY|nr:hypothetical protein PsYK624_049660 [Phanerochaete sordida]
MANATAALAALEEALSLSNGLLAARYLAAASLACAAYDFALMFDKEINLLWKRGFWDVSRAAYFFIRYMNFAGLLYAAYVTGGLSGPLDDRVSPYSCNVWLATLILNTGALRSEFLTISGLSALLTIGCANAFLTLRLFALWDHRRAAKIALFSIFGVTYSAVVVLFVWTLISIIHFTYYDEVLGACLLTRKPLGLIGVWIAMTTFDVLTIILGLSNALHQPYSQNVEVIMRFRRDGAIFFIAVFALRLINLVCSIALRKEYLLVNLFFVWGMVTVTTCRLIIRVEEIRTAANRHVRYRTYELGVWRSHHTHSLQ